MLINASFNLSNFDLNFEIATPKSGCWEKSLAEAPGGAHHELEPLLTCSAGAAVLSRVVLEIRVKLHGMTRVTQF